MPVVAGHGTNLGLTTTAPSTTALTATSGGPVSGAQAPFANGGTLSVSAA